MRGVQSRWGGGAVKVRCGCGTAPGMVQTVGKHVARGLADVQVTAAFVTWWHVHSLLTISSVGAGPRADLLHSHPQPPALREPQPGLGRLPDSSGFLPSDVADKNPLSQVPGFNPVPRMVLFNPFFPFHRSGH